MFIADKRKLWLGHNDRIIVNSEGSIKGIQFLIESAGELVVNPDLNMDIAYNKIHNYHYGLIYSLEGKSINGDFALLDITDDYIVKELILANNQNQIVEIFKLQSCHYGL